jgi:predicted TIM-barrel fold metal-dependent hydrolase
MPIDMHAHWTPKELYDALHERGKPPLPKAYDSVDERLAEMDKYGYSRGVLSRSPVNDLECLPAEEALPLCRAFNDATAAACRAFPDRFSGFAALPSADMETMIEEFERTVAMPGMVGAVLPGDGFRSLRRAERLRPLLKAANERGAVFLVHYGRIADDPDGQVKDLTDNPTPRRGTLDMQARLSENMVTFCLTDLLADYPNIRIIVHNLGGNIPFEIERMDHRVLVDADRWEGDLPSKRVREAPILVDCNSFGPRGIELAVSVYGAEKIVCGSDGTSFGMDWTNRAIVEARITEAEKQMIRDGNAEAALARA